MKIYISPSNQTSNRYATGGTNEAVQCQAIGELVGEMLREEYEDVEVYVAPINKPALERGDQANYEHYDCMICLHTNASGSANPGKANGTLGIYYKGDYKTLTLSDEEILDNKGFAEILVEKVSELTGKDLGLRTSQQTELVFCRCTGALVEMEFHDNEYGSNYIQSHHDQLAEAIVKATAEYFGLKKKEKQGELGENEFYCIQCGAYKNKENAERQLQRLRDAGFSSYIIIKDVEDKTYRDYYA